MFDLSEVVLIGINDLFLQTFDLSEVIPDFDAFALRNFTLRYDEKINSI